MSVNYPIQLGAFPLYRGDAQGRNKVTITLNDADGAPVNLTVFGNTWKAQARGGQELIDLVCDTTNLATGVLELRVPNNKSADLPDTLEFDAQVTGGTISPLTVFAGSFDVAGEVTT